MARRRRNRQTNDRPPLHPILNVLPVDTLSSISSSVSPEEMEVLAYMITIIFAMESIHPIPSSEKVKEAIERFPGILTTGKSAALGCRCFPCYKIYWEKWAATSPANRRRVHDALDALERSLSRWRSSHGCSKESSENSWRGEIGCLSVSMPALDDVVEKRSDQEDQESHRSFAGNLLAKLLSVFNHPAWSLWIPK